MGSEKSGIIFLGDRVRLCSSKGSVWGHPRFAMDQTWAVDVAPSQVLSELRDHSFSSLGIVIEQSNTRIWEASPLGDGHSVSLVPGEDLESLIHQTKKKGQDFLHYFCADNSPSQCLLSSVERSVVKPWLEAGETSEIPIVFLEFLDLILIRILSEAFVKGGLGLFSFEDCLIRVWVSPDHPFRITKVHRPSRVETEVDWQDPALLVSILRNDEDWLDLDLPLLLSDNLCRPEIIDAMGKIWPGSIFQFSQVFGTECSDQDMRVHLSNRLVRYPEYELWVSFSPDSLVKMAMSIVALGWIVSMSLPSEARGFLYMDAPKVSEAVFEKQRPEPSSLDRLIDRIKALRGN
jgi:hypothetical protein